MSTPSLSWPIVMLSLTSGKILWKKSKYKPHLVGQWTLCYVKETALKCTSALESESGCVLRHQRDSTLKSLSSTVYPSSESFQ